MTTTVLYRLTHSYSLLWGRKQYIQPKRRWAAITLDNRKFQHSSLHVTTSKPPNQKSEDAALFQGCGVSVIKQTSASTDLSSFRLFWNSVELKMWPPPRRVWNANICDGGQTTGARLHRGNGGCCGKYLPSHQGVFFSHYKACSLGRENSAS